MAAITISRQYGSGGDAIARDVASVLGYDLISKEQIVKAAGLAQQGAEPVAPTNAFHFLTGWYMQQIESRFEGQAKSRKISPSGETSFVPAELCYYELPDKLFEHHSVQNDVELQAREQRKSFFQKTIKLLWKRGNIIIVGRGANNVLKDEPDVLRVRLIAPLTTRAYRLVRKEGLNYEEALDNAVGMDSLRTRYVYESYQRHIEEETLYDLVLNTERLRLKAAVGLIVDTAQALEGSLETQVLRADRPWV